MTGMGHKFAEIAFTSNVRQIQECNGSRRSYSRLDAGPVSNDRLGDREKAFIAMRDSFYMATVSETGWPYVQHRGGPPGFLRVLGDRTIGFADFRGNRQYVSLGNLVGENRVSVFLMDYPNRTRLKLLGRATTIGTEQQDMLDRLKPTNYRAVAERGWLINVEAFDWNCPQHITPRYTLAELETASAPCATGLDVG